MKYHLFLLILLTTCNPDPIGSLDSSEIVNVKPNIGNSDVSPSDSVFLSPLWTVELNAKIEESSGLILWDGDLLSMNDDSDTRLYIIDTSSGEITGDYLLPGVENQDWEEIDHDANYVYVGDFGNNRGNRKNLHILRIEKQSLLDGNPLIDSICFKFSNQHSFDAAGLNQTEFDCEAFVVTSDSIYLFTKQWSSGHTTQYVLPAKPGFYTAMRRDTYDTRGLITGATLNEKDRVLILCGYSGILQPFIHLFYAYPDNDFFAGKNKRINLSLPFHQIEGVAFSKGTEYFLSNELSSPNINRRIPPRLHLIDLSEYLEISGEN